MKKLYLIIISVLSSVSVFGQINKVEQVPLQVNWDKTTHLIFPTSIKYFRSVNDFIVADKPETAENILSVKANRESFEKSSNISVATSDGKFYSFDVTYTDSLLNTNIFLENMSNQSPEPIYTNTANYTHLLFPSEIVYTDFGNGDLLEVSLAENLRNVLRMKAVEDFKNVTNVSVYTADKQFYTFDVRYNERETNYTFQIGDTTVLAQENQALLNSDELTDADKQTILQKINKKGRRIYNIGQKKNKIHFFVENIFTQANKLIFRMTIENQSNIKYDIDYIKFFIKDKKTSKQSASQELEMTPLFIDAFSYTIEGKNKGQISICFEKFTIPDNKDLVIEINEKEGGRHIIYKLKNSDIIDAENL